LRTLIADWRAAGVTSSIRLVQLPRFQKGSACPASRLVGAVSVRDEMRKTLSVPRTGMAITLDYGG